METVAGVMVEGLEVVKVEAALVKVAAMDSQNRMVLTFGQS